MYVSIGSAHIIVISNKLIMTFLMVQGQSSPYKMNQCYVRNNLIFKLAQLVENCKLLFLNYVAKNYSLILQHDHVS